VAHCHFVVGFWVFRKRIDMVGGETTQEEAVFLTTEGSSF
jgi:hypothetical protein